MNIEKREEIRRNLRRLAEVHAAMMDLMEHTLVLLNEELALDPFTFWDLRKPAVRKLSSSTLPVVDAGLFTVTFRSRSCFLGNSLLFRLFSRLARRPNFYVTYEDLLSDVWNGSARSDAAVRSVAKRLRVALRRGGMNDLADGIDGSEPGHYALKLKV